MELAQDPVTVPGDFVVHGVGGEVLARWPRDVAAVVEGFRKGNGVGQLRESTGVRCCDHHITVPASVRRVARGNRRSGYCRCQ